MPRSSSDITAVILAVAASVGVGVEAGVGVAIGISVARNFIGWDPYGDTSVVADYDTNHAPLTTLEKGKKVRVAEGALAGEVYEYIGDTVTVTDDANTPDIVEAIYLASQQYRDSRLWKHVNVSAESAQVRAYIANSSVHAAGDLTIDARDTASIDAVVVAAAVALAGGGEVGVAVSGAGVYSENKIATDVKAYIDGDGVVAATDGISAASVHVTAIDSSSIDAVAAAASIAASLGGTVGISAAIGLSLAFNEISNDVAAAILNADQGVTATTGDVTISALTLGRTPVRH